MKSLIIFLSLLFAASCFGWGIEPLQTVFLSAGDTGYDTTDITFWWNAEQTDADFSATNGTTDYSAGDDTGAMLGDVVINTDAKYSGTYGVDFPTSSDRIAFTSTSIVTDEEGRVGFWLYITTFADNRPLFVLYDDASNYLRVRLEGTNNIGTMWRSSGSNTYWPTTTGLISTGSWLFIEYAWKNSTNYQQFWVDGTNAGTTTSSTMNDFAGSPVYIYFGDSVGVSADHHSDHFIITTDSTKSLYEARVQLNYDNSN